MKSQQPRSFLSTLLSVLIVLLVLFILVQGYSIVKERRTPSLSAQTAQSVPGDSVSSYQINVLNGCGVSGIGLKMTTYSRRLGYDVVEMGNYKVFTLEHSMIIDRCGNLAAAKLLAEKLGIDQKRVVQQMSRDYFVSASIVIGKDFKELTPWKVQ